MLPKEIDAIENEALDALDNGNEKLAYELYMKVLTEEKYLDMYKADWEDMDLYFELIIGKMEFVKNVFDRRKYCLGAVKLTAWVSDDFTEEHKKDLEQAVKDAVMYVYGGDLEINRGEAFYYPDEY